MKKAIPNEMAFSLLLLTADCKLTTANCRLVTAN